MSFKRVFREGKNRSLKGSVIRRKDLSVCCLLKESASILEQASRIRRFEIGRFCDKIRPFCTILENPPRYMCVSTSYEILKQNYSKLSLQCGMTATTKFVLCLYKGATDEQE